MFSVKRHKAMPNTKDDDYVFLSAKGLEDKYKKLIVAGAGFAVLGLMAVGAAYTYQHSKGVYHLEYKTFGQILPFLLLFISGYGVSIFRQGYGEKRLYYKAAMNGLMLDDRGISGPIALLEGPIRDHIRDVNKDCTFRVPWDAIEDFIVEPSRGKKGQAPPYYKVTIKGGDGGIQTSYFILRSFFMGREQQILDYVGTRLEAEHIVLNDEIIEEDENHGS
jgi:hypothetical protein